MHRALIAYTPLGESWWATTLKGKEALSSLYEFTLGLESDDPDIDCQALIGETAAVELEAQEGGKRYFSGQIVKVSAKGQQGRHWAYEAILAPKLWHASRRADFKIWQSLTVRDIVNEVLNDNALRFEWRLKNAYKTWEYLVQYGETDLAFIGRLLEHEGIYYWFEHGEGGETLILGDHFSVHETFGGYENIPFYPPDEARTEEDHYFGWRAEREPESGRFQHRDYDFKRPSKDLTAEHSDPRGHLFDQYEIYAYPGNYNEPDDGRAYAMARLEALQRKQDVIELKGRVRGAVPGSRFTLYNHPRADQNRDLLITHADYDVRNNTYEGGAEETGGSHFEVTIEAIPAVRQYRAERTTPKPRTRGPETAVVVGPAGSEIHTDPYGRVKVHFHWDRYGQKDGKDSCWIRVSYPWAGTNFGGIHIPRVGQEVIVDFEHGDPDRPIVTGRVYNAEQMPPWDLPANSTQSGLLTRSSPRGAPGNANAIRFEDAKGGEEVWIHAERNQRIEVESCESHSVGANRAKSIGQDETTAVGRHRTQTVGGKHVETVGKDIAVNSVEGNIVATALAKSIKLEAEKHIVFKVGESVIVMNADGTIQIYGPQRVDINPDGVKVPRIRAARPGEDKESELLDALEEFDVLGDIGAFEGAVLPMSAPAKPSAGASSSAGFSAADPRSDPAVQAIIAKSPTLQADLQKLKNDPNGSWKILYGPAGGGSTVNRNRRLITIDGKERNNPTEVVQSISHEVGHALYPYTPDYSSKTAYVNGTLADEGAATLKNIEIQREILANGGPNIGIAGNPANHAAYNAAYDQYRKDGNAVAAHATIGGILGTGETTSSTHQTYADYYGGWYDSAYGTGTGVSVNSGGAAGTGTP